MEALEVALAAAEVEAVHHSAERKAAQDTARIGHAQAHGDALAHLCRLDAERDDARTRADRLDGALEAVRTRMPILDSELDAARRTVADLHGYAGRLHGQLVATGILPEDIEPTPRPRAGERQDGLAFGGAGPNEPEPIS